MLRQQCDQRAAGRSPLLLLADPLDRHRQTACRELLSADDADAAIVFAYHRTPREIVENHRDSEALTIITLGENTGSGGLPTGAQRGVENPFEGDVTVENCSPSDLTGLGVSITHAIDRHSESDLSVCLGSLTTLLQYVDLETAFKFLHVTLSRFDAADATVHGTLDPSAVEEQSVATLTSLFESTMDGSDGEWTKR